MRALLVVVTALFSAFTAWAVWRTGLAGFFPGLLATPAGWQVLVDLVVALTLVLAWMWRDARARGRPFWPFALLTLALGSLGPLVYLALRRPGPRTPA